MKRRVGFTLVEIMIVVAIIGLLAAIAIPAFMKARTSARRNACINNLRQIDGAKDEYVLEYGGTNGGAITWPNVALYIKDMSNKCICPGSPTKATDAPSNTYTLGVIGVDPTCLITPGIHALTNRL